MNKLKISMIAAVLFAQGCTQGPDIGKLDDTAMRKLGDEIIDVYTLNESAIKDWFDDKADFEAKVEAIRGINESEAKISAINKLIDEMDLVQLIDDVKPFDLEEKKAKLLAIYQARLDAENKTLTKVKAEFDAYLPIYNESKSAYEKGEADRAALSAKKDQLNKDFQDARNAAIESLSQVGIGRSSDLVKGLTKDWKFRVYSYNYSEKISKKSCRELNNATSGKTLTHHFYSDASIDANKTEISCASFIVSFSDSSVSKLGEPQLNAITNALNKAIINVNDGNQLVKLRNEYYKTHPDIADLHDRYRYTDRRKMEGLESSLKYAQEGVDRVALPSDQQIIDEVVMDHFRTVTMYEDFHINNLLLNELEYVSTVGSDGRFKLDNTEDFNLFFIHSKRKFNQKAAFKVIRLAEFGDSPLAVVDFNGILQTKDFQTITL
ncbi:hypothetical protein [Shewanella aestuarii]|uniref:Lipoprotein n=1 Tax=Shewanella aestuarii TaxID=1028752 RepID=A0A6G9QPA2_9GAMM|nr:hypothetical protein [Shewanella aestuarii]QIR16396.1 hypothetical protein HBH39_18130 [Shewanella aestuarii]